MIREQEVVKYEEGPAQGPSRGVDQLVRGRDPSVFFPQEAGEVVYAGYQSVRERVGRK